MLSVADPQMGWWLAEAKGSGEAKEIEGRERLVRPGSQS
jgi:hypothetical protein